MGRERSPQISAAPLFFVGFILIIFNLISVIRILQSTNDSNIKGTIFEDILMNMIIDKFTMIILGLGLILFASSVALFTKESTDNIQDSVVKGDEHISKRNLPNPLSKGVIEDGFEWLEHGESHYYRPENQPNTKWQRWQG